MRTWTDDRVHFSSDPLTLTIFPSIPDLVKSLRKEFGPIYGLVNNAGLGTSGILATMHDEKIEASCTPEHSVSDHPDQVCSAIDDG